MLALRLFVLIALTVSIAWSRGQAAERPDIFILLTDQQQADALGINGTPGVRTPAMDRLAREGVRFTQAFCATPQCSPSRAALLTGRYPHRTGVVGNVRENPTGPRPAGMSPPLETGVPNLCKILSTAGYQTAYFGKWHLGGNPGAYGFEVHDARGSNGKGLVPLVTSFLKKCREGPDRRPLLLIASWLNPHDIYQIANHAKRDAAAESKVALPPSLADALTTKPLPQRHYLEEDQGKPFRNYTPDEWRRYLVFYYQLLEQVDSEIGEVLEEVRKTGRSSLTIFTTDHGDLGGAHGLPFKGPAMYEELMRVPLLISWPDKIKPAVSHALVSSIDILPTVCALVGIRPPAEIDGVSLQAVLENKGRGQTAKRDAIFAEYYGKQNWRVPIRMIRTETWKYVLYRHYGEELYDLRSDPHEIQNLAGNARHSRIQQELAGRLHRWMTQTGDSFLRLTVTDRAGRELPAGAK